MPTEEAATALYKNRFQFKKKKVIKLGTEKLISTRLSADFKVGLVCSVMIAIVGLSVKQKNQSLLVRNSK